MNVPEHQRRPTRSSICPTSFQQFCFSKPYVAPSFARSSRLIIFLIPFVSEYVQGGKKKQDSKFLLCLFFSYRNRESNTQLMSSSAAAVQVALVLRPQNIQHVVDTVELLYLAAAAAGVGSAGEHRTQNTCPSSAVSY